MQRLLDKHRSDYQTLQSVNKEQYWAHIQIAFGQLKHIIQRHRHNSNEMAIRVFSMAKFLIERARRAVENDAHYDAFITMAEEVFPLLNELIDKSDIQERFRSHALIWKGRLMVKARQHLKSSNPQQRLLEIYHYYQRAIDSNTTRSAYVFQAQLYATNKRRYQLRLDPQGNLLEDEARLALAEKLLKAAEASRYKPKGEEDAPERRAAVIKVPNGNEEEFKEVHAPYLIDVADLVSKLYGLIHEQRAPSSQEDIPMAGPSRAPKENEGNLQVIRLQEADGSTTFFHEIDVPGENYDCYFYALQSAGFDIGRQSAAQQLRDNRGNELIRRLIAPEIESLMIEGILPEQVGLDRLRQLYFIIDGEVDRGIQEMNEALRERGIRQSENAATEAELLAYPEDNFPPQRMQTFRDAIGRRNNLAQRARIWVINDQKNVYLNFIEHFIQGRIGPEWDAPFNMMGILVEHPERTATIDAIAHLNGIHLRIVHVRADGEANIIHEYNPQLPNQQLVTLRHNNWLNHFSLLIPRAQQEEVEQEEDVVMAEPEPEPEPLVPGEPTEECLLLMKIKDLANERKTPDEIATELRITRRKVTGQLEKYDAVMRVKAAYDEDPNASKKIISEKAGIPNQTVSDILIKYWGHRSRHVSLITKEEIEQARVVVSRELSQLGENSGRGTLKHLLRAIQDELHVTDARAANIGYHLPELAKYKKGQYAQVVRGLDKPTVAAQKVAREPPPYHPTQLQKKLDIIRQFESIRAKNPRLAAQAIAKQMRGEDWESIIYLVRDSSRSEFKKDFESRLAMVPHMRAFFDKTHSFDLANLALHLNEHGYEVKASAILQRAYRAALEGHPVWQPAYEYIISTEDSVPVINSRLKERGITITNNLIRSIKKDFQSEKKYGQPKTKKANKRLPEEEPDSSDESPKKRSRNR